MNLTAVADVNGEMVTDTTSETDMTSPSSSLGLGRTGKKGVKFGFSLHLL